MNRGMARRSEERPVPGAGRDAVRREAAERPGAADHDGDSDDSAVTVELSRQS